MSHQNNPSVSITNSTTSFSMPTTFSSPIKQEFPNNLISLQQHPDFCEIPRDISNSSLDRRRSSGSITLLSNYEDSRHDLIKDGESSGHYSSFGAQNNKIVPSNMRLSQGNNSINTKNCNQVGGFIIPKEEQQCGNTSVPDKEKQKQTKKENTSVGFGGIEEKPIHECDACGKRLCSSRSLKRHKSTCKKVKAEIEQNQDSGGFIVSPPLSKPVTENISGSKMNEQIVQKKIQIQRNSTGNLIFSDNKNENANLNQPIIRQCSSEYLSTQQPFCLAQPPPQNCSSSSSFASNNNSPIKFCNIMDPQGGGLSSPPIQQQQQHFYSKQPSYSSSAQIQVLQQETYFNKKDGEKVIPITASDEQPNKVSDVVDSVVAKLRLQSGGGGGVLNTRPPITTNCITNSCNISTATNPQLQYLPQQKHFNVPVEWNEGNISLQQQQQLGESNQQSTHFTMFYSNSQQQQNFQQQRQQYFAGDNSTRTTEILPTQQNNQLNNNQNEQTKFSQSKSSTSMTLQQNSWQPINSQQLIHQQPQPVGLHRHSSGGSDNINLMSPTLSSEETPIISGRIGQQNERKLTNSFNEQIKSQQLNEPSIKNTLTETDKLPPTSISLKSTVLSSPPPIQQQQRPRANSGNTNKNVYRYLCPECDKPYSCRKNVKRHRISQHKVPSQEAQDGQIKRIRLNEEDLQKDENIKKQSNASKSKEIIKKEEIDKEQKNLKEKELKREEMSRQNSSTSLKSPPINHQNILQSPDYHFQQQPSFPPSMQKQQNFQKQPSIQNLRDERQFQHHQGQRHPYYFQYPPVNQPQQEQRFVGQQHIDEAQNTFYEIPQHQIVQQPQQYIQGQQQQYHYHQQQQQLIYQDPQQQQKKFNQQQQYYGSQIITYPPPPLPTQQSSFQQQTNQQQQKIIMVQQQCNHQNSSEIGYNIQQQPGPSNRSNYYCNNNQYSSNNTYPQQYTMTANNNEYPITYQEGYYQQVEQQQRQQYAPQPITYNNNTYSDTLDCWEQIKPDVDTGHTVVDPDAMARIVADLKQTEEVTEKHNQQARIVQQQTIKRQQKEQQNNLQYCHLDNGMIVSSDNIDTTTGMFNQQSGIQRKAVELAEADTTFSPPSQPDDSLSRQISQKSHQGVGTQQFPQKIIPLNHQLQPTQQSPTTYQPIMSASNTSRQQQNVFRFDINNSSIPPKELNSIEHEKFHQIEWNYQGGINNNNLISQHKYQHSQTIQSPPYSLTNIPQENKLTNQKIKKESLSTKKQSNTSTKTSQQNTGTFVCPACTKAYSTDYSLKRHKNVCPALNPGKLQTEKKGNTSRKRKINNVNVATSSTNNNDESGSIKNTKADEPHQIDPDSTMNESPPDNAGGSNSLINARRISVNGTSTNNSTIGNNNNNNGDNAEEQNKSLQLQMATVIQL